MPPRSRASLPHSSVVDPAMPIPAGSDYITCVPKALPEDMRIAAASTAISINHANQPPIEAMAMAMIGLVSGPLDESIMEPGRLAVLTTKYWGSGGVKLTVSFLEPCPADLRDRIISHMNAWSQYANVSFVWTQGVGQVRITRSGQGYWSYIGVDVLHIGTGEPTMCLQAFTMNTPESEYKRVVRHETGHCLSASMLIDCPRDLNKYPLGIPISELVGQQPWVYAWKDGQVVVRRASRVWLSKKNVQTVRVRLRTGRGYHKGQFRPPLELIGTPDHPVLLADGVTWKNLGDLKAGDRLCSLYRSKNGKRSRLTWTGLGDRVREHAFVAEQVYGVRPEGHDCHHKDENQLNQDVDS